MDRILYFGYVVLTSVRHRKKMLAFSQYYNKKYKRSVKYFLVQAYLHYLKYDMHPLDYFYYDVYANDSFLPEAHADTLFMYRFHKKLNKKKHVKYFYNKILFHQTFKKFMGHKHFDLKRTQPKIIENWILNERPEYIIIKRINSVGGFGVKKLNIGYLGNEIYINNKLFKAYCKELEKFDLLEEFVNQHQDITKLNPSCLNTVRVVTIVDREGIVNIPGAVIRLGVNSDVDNFHSGGIAININLESGRLEGEGFRLNPSDEKTFSHHPVTKIKLDGYQLPNWQMVIETVKKAAYIVPLVRTVGWDVAITPKGVSLIEGNHDWDKIIIEKAIKRGIRNDLVKYL